MSDLLDYDKIASQYAQNRQLHPQVFRDLLLTSQVQADDSVLEVGCGTGNYIAAFQSSIGCSCWGIDPSEGMLSKAKEQSDSINFQLSNAESIGFANDYFDLVFSVDVIHHVGERLDYFRKAHRVLKAGGNVCTVTDSEWIIRHRQPLATYFPETVAVELRRYPRIAQLRQMIEQVGLEDIAEKTVEFRYELRDIRAFENKAFSALHLISEEAFQKGIDRMRRELVAGPIPCVSRYLLLWGTKKTGR